MQGGYGAAAALAPGPALRAMPFLDSGASARDKLVTIHLERWMEHGLPLFFYGLHRFPDKNCGLVCQAVRGRNSIRPAELPVPQDWLPTTIQARKQIGV